MLDPRVPKILFAVRAGRLPVDEAVRQLLQVRRDTGCLSLMASGTSSDTERALVERYTALATAEFGSP